MSYYYDSQGNYGKHSNPVIYSLLFRRWGNIPRKDIISRMKKHKLGIVTVCIVGVLIVAYGLGYLTLYIRANSDYNQTYARYTKCYNRVVKQKQQDTKIVSSGRPNVLDPMAITCQNPMPITHTTLWLP